MFEMTILTPPERSHINPIAGQIKINSFVESFNMSIFTWRPQDYFDQWESAIAQLLRQKDSTAVLISEITSPCKDDYYFCWTLYRYDKSVHIQNNLIFLNKLKGKFDINKLASYSPSRKTETEDGEKISEWHASIKDFEDYFKKIPKLRKPYEEHSCKLMESVYKFKI
ncbi:MAG TPA: hypothetical protein VHO28_01605 [Ignavibacteriales bacterium]|nr:hypothetical protein [Ignavibacteriales bacterium]